LWLGLDGVAADASAAAASGAARPAYVNCPGRGWPKRASRREPMAEIVDRRRQREVRTVSG
jgi:hypothetical protein